MFKKYILFFLLIWGGMNAFGQADLTLYNMNWTPQSMYQNPALTPPTKVNIGLPVISSIYGQFANTGFVWKDLFQLDSNDSLDINVDNMLDKLAARNYLMANVNMDYLSFGIRRERSYWSFNVTEKLSTRFTYPEDFFRLLWKGNAQFLGSAADFSGVGLDASSYREIGLGYTRDIDEEGKLKIGGKIKYLNGTWNIYTKRSNMSLETDETFFWLTANSDFEVRTSGFNNDLFGMEAEIVTDSSGNTSKKLGQNVSPGTYLLGKNHGVGVDIGFSYEVIDSMLRISGSLVDLGFIRWRNDPLIMSSNDASFQFKGIDLLDFPDQDTNVQSVNDADQWFQDSVLTPLIDSMTGAFAIDSAIQKYNAPTIPRFYLGANYIINEKMDAGLLFSGEVYHGKFRPSVTLSYNLKLGKWLQLSPTWSYTNRSFLNPGLGISLNAGPVQFYAVMDNLLTPFAPQSTKMFHVHSGINLTFGREESDRDGDGVIDKEDQCPDTPGLVEFDGCPDTDGDKIIDLKDKCPDTPGLPEFEGCPDRDGDGIQDSEDDCPDDPGKPEFNGCPDRDGDGIKDIDDSCPDEPGPKETNGCPDKDHDTVIDSEDDCPEKPGDPAHKGCPDSDGDGLYDNEDRCPDDFGPQDNFGCPYGDLDKDGLYDKEDRCPDTPGPKENQGCPYGDLDGDGVNDKDDECPNTPGTIENKGCPELTDEEQEILDLAFQNLEFETGKAIIKTNSLDELDSLAKLLVDRPDWRLRIAGHTDNVGNDAANMTLSKNRANAVKDYLNSRGVAEERFIVEWYGESQPIAPNDTPEGRQKNRRVEMEVKFE